jgi:hypothetical protein
MLDQACDFAINGRLQNHVLRIRTHVVRQFADEIAEVRRQ